MNKYKIDELIRDLKWANFEIKERKRRKIEPADLDGWLDKNKRLD